jgi:hypothetical protein
MVAPAAGFYGTAGLGSDEVRIAYVLNAADLEASVKILASGLEKYAAVRGPCAATEAVEPVGAAAGGPDFTPTGT